MAVFAAAAVVAWLSLRSDSAPTYRTRPGELTVAAAVSSAGPEPVTVRGWVFNDPGFDLLRLCHGYQAGGKGGKGGKGKAPSCIGPFIDLYNVDRAAFSLRSGEDGDGRPVVWNDKPVAVYGTLSGTAFTVQSVLQ